ncbi:ATP-binding protein [Deinococcus apachensis]|uniref:ATP-binding protein n=1 Tax=Deinococcus apachensis TaxID=309886 RepID=UPI00248101E3|nr:tetratricopeptide repeat protein [Deinococcus apachensis]
MEGHLRVLGAASVEVNAHPQPLVAEAPLWLVTLLGCHEGPVTRPEVLALLYPDQDEAVARNRLRNLLHRVRHLPWGDAVRAERETLHWSGWADVRTFRQACGSGHWPAALKLYRGPLLEGLRPAGLPEFEAWLDAERDDLHGLWLEALLGQAAELERAGRAAEALGWLERLLNASPYQEDAVQAALRCAGLLRDPAEAEHLYARFRTVLGREMGLAPSPDTTRLYEAVRSGTGPAWSQGRPAVTTPLFGRHGELQWLGERLDDPGCRLLTVTGPGGAGKTRLAQEALRLAADPRVGPALFVPLETAGSVAEVVSALATALGLAVGGAEPPERQVTDALQAGPALLVLDNLEHLLAAQARADVLALLMGLLEQAPGLRLIVTSRVRLGLQAEWVLGLGGLDFPAVPDLAAAAGAGAVRLFVERARRVRPGLALSASTLPDILAVCRLTGGLPLALELTAASVGTLELRDVVTELEASLDLAEDGGPDRPERHRSLRAAFEQSWRLLGEPEQALLARLSVFSGGLDLAAARPVGGVGLRPLLALGEHSLLHRDGEGRYTLHAAIRQYAAEKLEGRPADQDAATRAHTAWFADLALRAAPELHGPDQQRWLAALQTEHDNLRAALSRLLAARDAAQALEVTAALHWFWYVRGHHREGYAALTAALALGGEPAPRAAALSRAAGLARDLGDYARGGEWLQEALSLARAAGRPELEAEALHGLGLHARELGRLEEARPLFEEAGAIQRRLSGSWGLATTLNDLGIMWAMGGDPTRARPLFEESLDLKRRIGDRQGVAYALANLGNVTDDSAEFRRLTEQSLEIKRELGDRQGVANSLFNLADLHIGAGELGTARTHLAEALTLFWQLGRKRSVAMTLLEFAKLTAAEGRAQTCLLLAGAGAALLRAAGVPAQGVEIGDVLAGARAAAGEEAGRWEEAGRLLPLEEAVHLAVGDSAPGTVPA